MPSIVTDTELASLTTDLNNAFDTFSQNRDIVIWKEPKQVPIPPSSAAGASFGFGGGEISQEFTYIPVSGVFKAVVRYASTRKIGRTELLQDTNAFVPIGEVKIKVTQDCHSFIGNGKTDKISFDNRDWYFAGEAQACPFMGTLYYMYQLKPKI
jgi:hypothetical protein